MGGRRGSGEGCDCGTGKSGIEPSEDVVDPRDDVVIGLDRLGEL